MRTVGIIAEYNPFHTGHAYHIIKAKEASGADYAVVVMSPDFVQRGEPAMFDKYTRTRMALQNGADLVLELPVCYATASAEYFALGAVTLLDRLGIVDALCFGAENADSSQFENLASILAEEPPEYTACLRQMLKQGKSFPAARSEALATYLGQDAARKFSDLLSFPNNILGVEYCKALQKLRSSIRPLPVLRKGSSYHSAALDGLCCSSTAIRSEVTGANAADVVLRYIPEHCRSLFLNACKSIVTSEELLPFLTQKLLISDSFDSFFDISHDLSDRIRNLRFLCIGKKYAEIVSLLKSRQLTEAHIRRALIHILLDIRSADIQDFCANGTIPYIRMLGMRRDASPVLHRIKEVCALPFITKPASMTRPENGIAERMWQQNLFASHLYRSIQIKQTQDSFCTEYELSPIIL